MRRTHRALVSLLALVALAPSARAAPPDVPPEVVAKAGKVKEIVLKVPAGKNLEFRHVGTVAAFREMKGDSDTERVFWLVPEEDGPAHIVWWYTGEKGSSVTAINKGAAPVPPKPPEPPVPPKPPDPPADPLIATVQTAYAADPSATKSEDRAALAAVYVATAEAIQSVTTAGDLFAVVKGATEARIAGRLKSVRPLFGAELEKVLPTDPAAQLTAAQRDEAAKQFKRFATVLGSIR